MIKYVCIILLSLILNQCKKKDVYFLEVPDTGEPPAVDIAIQDFTAEGYKKHSLNWTLKADTSYIVYASSKVEMKSVKLIYHENPRETSVLTCDGAIMNRETNDLTLNGNVIIKSSIGRELYTDILYWDSKKEQLFTDLPVKIIYSNGEVINGKGLKSNGTLSKIVIYQPVGVHTVEEKK
jgi:LPS export ABC transporter protein LptC